MSDTFELLEGEAESEEAPKKRRLLCLILGSCAVLLGLCVLLFLGGVFQHRLRSRLASYDTRLIVGIDEDPQPGLEAYQATARVMRGRLRSIGVLGRVEASKGEVRISLKSGDVEVAKDFLLRSADLRLMIVEHELSEAERAEALAAIRAKGSHEPEAEALTAAPWHESASGGTPGEWVLLRTEGAITGSDFKSFYQALDSRGLPRVGFTMTVAGRKKLFALTSANFGRQLAIVFEGQVRSAPVIAGPIGKKGIIDGGQNGWSPQELRDLLALLDAGTFPYRVELLKEERIGR